MALTLADGTPSALVLDFVLALVLESVLELDGRSATYTNEMAHQGRSDALSTALRGNQIACSATWEGSSTQGGSDSPETSQCKLSPCRDDSKGSTRAVKTRLSKDLMREVISGN